MRLSLAIVIALARVASADTISGTDETVVTGTMSALGKADAVDQRDTIRWHADGARVTIDSGGADEQKLAQGRAFEASLAGAIGAQTFALDEPRALPPDQLAALAEDRGTILAQRVVVTWTGTANGVAHYRVYAIFAIASTGTTGLATLAGALDLDVSRHALVDARLSAVIATGGLLRLDAKATAHLTRSYR